VAIFAQQKADIAFSAFADLPRQEPTWSNWLLSVDNIDNNDDNIENNNNDDQTRTHIPEMDGIPLREKNGSCSGRKRFDSVGNLD